MAHTHGSTTPDEPTYDRAYWEDRYGTPELTWSGNPNPVLVAEATSLTPGSALDIGSGEGGDALWLAAQGWHVTGVDISQNALDKAAARVESVDAEAAARIQWQQHDLAEWLPEPRSFDLVSSQFMHLPRAERGVLFRGLAAAVAPGGTLLIVGHDITDMDLGEHEGHKTRLMFGVDEVVATIDGQGLSVEVAEVRVRENPQPTSHHLKDVVVRAVRAA